MSTLLEQLTRLSSTDNSFSNYDPELEHPTTVTPPTTKKVRGRPQKASSNEPVAEPLADEEDETLDASRALDELNGLNLDDIRPAKQGPKLSSYEKMMESGAVIRSRNREALAGDFDRFLDDRFDNDEDHDLTNSLVSFGRKYARETAISGDSSEIAKAFSASEKKLKELMDEITYDKEFVESTLRNMRGKYGANTKTIADLVMAKNSYHSTQLSIIKEMNAIKKTQFDLRYKDAAAKSKENDSVGADSSNMFKELFGLGRGSMIDAAGGYESISGAGSNGNTVFDQDFTNDDDLVEALERARGDVPETDGDKFLRYEGRGVHLVLLVTKEDDIEHYDIIAEDAEGNYVPDFPVPANPEQLTFDVNASTGEATDQLRQVYTVRYL